jgi:hypothetical protein
MKNYILSLSFALTVASTAHAESTAELRASVLAAGRAIPGAVPLGPTRGNSIGGSVVRSYGFSIEPRQCIVVIAHGSTTLGNVDVWINRGSASISRDSTTARTAEARYCGHDRPERLIFYVRGMPGRGIFVAQVFRLTSKAVPGKSAE